MAKFDLERLREVAIPITQRPRKHTEQEKKEAQKRLHEYFAKGKTH